MQNIGRILKDITENTEKRELTVLSKQGTAFGEKAVPETAQIQIAGQQMGQGHTDKGDRDNDCVFAPLLQLS